LRVSDIDLYTSLRRAREYADEVSRKHREHLADVRAEHDRAERAATAQHARNQELNKRQVLAPWQDPLARKQQNNQVSNLIQAVQDGCGELLLLTASMIDRTVHFKVMHRLITETRAQAKQRYGNDPTRLATNDALFAKRYREIADEQMAIVRASIASLDLQAKERVRILAPKPTEGLPWREGTYAPHGYRPSAEVLAATNPPPSVQTLRKVDYYPPRMPGFVPKVVAAKNSESKT
jgi:hypothetical protein